MITDFCVICGKKDGLHNHHIIPRSHGGTNDKTNLLSLCEKHHAWIHQLRPNTWNNHGKLIREALENAKRKGVVLGRKTNLTPQIERKIREMKFNNIGLKKIATECAVAVKTVRNVLADVA